MKMALRLTMKLLLLGFIMSCSAMLSQGDPMSCSRVYKFSGPSAMLHSPECSYLNSIDRGLVNTSCLARSANGLREYQDLSPCTLGVDMPLSGDNGAKDVRIIGSAVFSRNNGTKTIDKASHLKVLMNYFSLHTRLLAQARQFTGKLDDDSFYLRLLKEALVRTAKDANEIFSSEAYLRKLASDSTVTIALSVHGHILVANIGHPKTSVWAMKLQPWGEHKLRSYRLLLKKNRNCETPAAEVDALKFVESSGRTRLVLKELANNHLKDGRPWIQSAFDLVLDSLSVPRENDPVKSFLESFHSTEDSFRTTAKELLDIMRSMEDSFHASRRITSSLDPVPEVLEVMASDDALASQRLGMYQVIAKMNLRDDCSLLWEEEANINQKNSTAELHVSTVITRDHVGNMAAVVVPLQN